MDVQVVIIGAVVFVISAVLIYLISAFTMKEKTFEEVIAEQKRQQEAEREKARLEKKLEKEGRKKFKKKEKSKDKSPQASPQASLQTQSSGSGSDQEGKDHKMVELELEPEIIEPLEVKPIKQTKKKEKPAKSILHNKDEKTPVAPESVVQQVIHSRPPPKDVVELKHSHEKEKAKKEKTVKDEVEPKAEPVVVEEIVVKKESKSHSAAPPTAETRTSAKKTGK